ncbi:MAG TPA: DUF433 domain-containing protein [Candidatus Angelobacter sp.]|nr:DUF433 domain-containing protein [Candidatus Angelobacter sp.]
MDSYGLRRLTTRTEVCHSSIGRNVPRMERVPGKVSGAWVLRGTHMPVATIFENLEAGSNIDEILKLKPGALRNTRSERQWRSPTTPRPLP